MKLQRSRVNALGEAVWVKPWDELEFEVLVVPSEGMMMKNLYHAINVGGETKRHEMRICRQTFVDFRGYEEDGKAVPNTLENRIQLFGIPVVHDAVLNAVTEETARVTEGNAEPGSD